MSIAPFQTIFLISPDSVPPTSRAGLLGVVSCELWAVGLLIILVREGVQGVPSASAKIKYKKLKIKNTDKKSKYFCLLFIQSMVEVIQKLINAARNPKIPDLDLVKRSVRKKIVESKNQNKYFIFIFLICVFDISFLIFNLRVNDHVIGIIATKYA